MSDDDGRRPPAYSITEVEVLDEEAAARYAQITGPAVARYGGRFLVLAAEPTVAEGESPADQRMVVIEFPDMHRLEEWYESPEYAPARELARTALRRRLRFVEGVTGVTGAAATTEDAAVANVRRFYEAMNTGDVSAAEEILVRSTPCGLGPRARCPR